MDVVGFALELDEPPGQLVQRLAIAADVAQQRNGLRGDRGGLRDHVDDLLHLRPELAKLVEVDRAGGREHLVDRVVHCADEAGDRPAVERGQECLPDGDQHLADDVVGAVLVVLDRLEQHVGRRAVAGELLQGLRRFDQGRGMRLEHSEKVALLGQQPLKPGEHDLGPRDVLAGPLEDRRKSGNAWREGPAFRDNPRTRAEAAGRGPA